MKKLIAILALSMLTGCASVVGMIPSFWDDNQSARIVDVRLKADSIDCAKDQLAQAQSIQADLRWFELYSESKGRRQQDVVKLIAPMQETVNDWTKRAADSQATVGYCEIKKKIIQTQARTAASAILGRF